MVYPIFIMNTDSAIYLILTIVDFVPEMFKYVNWIGISP